MADAVQQFVQEENTTAKFPVNYDCAFEMFERLGFNECMNLAEAYDELQCVADRIYKRKFNKFTFDFTEPIDRILYHAGPSVKSLTLILNKTNVKATDLIKISDTCKQLQRLTLKGFHREIIGNNPFASVIDNLEVLSLQNCCLADDEDFFGDSKNLKSLNLLGCRGVQNITLKNCFEKNEGITSFTCDTPQLFYPRLLLLLPKLERVSLRYSSRHMHLNMLSKLQSLRHLTLRCWDENVNDILADLAKTNILEELVLIDVAVDADTFAIIKAFKNLQLLVVTTHNCEFPSSDALPTSLKTLRLGGFSIADHIISPLVKRLTNLEDFHLSNCELERSGYSITDFDSMADLVLDELNGHNDRQLDMILTSFFEDLPEVNFNKQIEKRMFCSLTQTNFSFSDNYECRRPMDL